MNVLRKLRRIHKVNDNIEIILYCYTIGATREAGTISPSRESEFNPTRSTSGFQWCWYRSIFSFLCNVLQIIVCPFVLFFGHCIVCPSTIYGFYIVLVAYVASFSGLSFLNAPSIFSNVHRYDVVPSTVKANESLKHLSDIKSPNIYKTTVSTTFEVNNKQGSETIHRRASQYKS